MAARLLLALFAISLFGGQTLAGMSVWASAAFTLAGSLAILLICNEIAVSR